MSPKAQNIPKDADKILSSCSKKQIEAAIKEFEKVVKFEQNFFFIITSLQDDERQCLVTKKQLISKDQGRGDFKDVDDNDVKSNAEKTDLKALYIAIGIIAGLILIIAFLCFCLLTKRDLSPCPRQSNFGRRYSQLRRTVRHRVR